VAEVKQITVILPFKLPTWNQLFAMRLQERMRIKKWIRNVVSMCIQDAGGSQIPMGSVLRPRLTVLDLEVYSLMIQPSMSKVSRFPKKFRRGMRR